LRELAQRAELTPIVAANPAASAELGMLSPAGLNWHAHLWRYIVQTPSDFQGFDRRFVHQRLYTAMAISRPSRPSCRYYGRSPPAGALDAFPLGRLRGCYLAMAMTVCSPNMSPICRPIGQLQHAISAQARV
jgi:hypothetical protein